MPPGLICERRRLVLVLVELGGDDVVLRQITSWAGPRATAEVIWRLVHLLET